MKQISIEIAGASPLLVHRFPEQEQLEASSGEHSRREAVSDYEAALSCLYLLDGALPYLPAENIRQSLIAAAGRHKIGRKAASSDAAAALYIEPDAIPLLGEWVIDKRPVVIPATRGRIIRVRPRFDYWSLRFVLNVETTLISLSLVRKIVDDAGNYVGVGDFRPAKKGPYGRFTVTLWKE